MRMILKVWSGNRDHNAGCDYATAEISEEFARLTLRRINILSEQKALDPSLYETYYWDSSPEYFGLWVNGASQAGEGQESSVGLDEMLENLEVDTLEIVTAPSDFRIPEGHAVAVECSQMIVRDSGVAFTTVLRHADIYVTTAEIAKDIIESAISPAAA